MENWKDPITPIFWLGGGIFLFLLLLGFIYVFIKTNIRRIRQEEQEKHEMELTYQKELLKTSIDTQEKERKRIAEELHDNVITQLYRIKLTNTEDQVLDEMLKDGITLTRTISHKLSPPFLEYKTVGMLIQEFIEPYTNNYKTQLHYLGHENGVSEMCKLNVFRIFQEVITNIHKHAKASCMCITYRWSENNLCLVIQDNGVGINLKSEHGMGMQNIASRTQILDGRFKFKLNCPNGTTFILVVKNG